MRSAAIAVAALSASLLVPGSTVLAQGLPRPGDRVRVTSGVYQPLVSQVKAISADSLVVSANGTDVHLAMAQVSLLEKGVGQKSQFLTGGLIGLLAGAGVGAIAGLASGDDPPGWFSFTAEQKAIMGAVVLGGIGGAVGLIAGALIKTERWVEVPLDNVGLSFAPQRDGRFRLGMSISF